MDFFATGGFQQLYSDLDDEQEPLAILAGLSDEPSSCSLEYTYPDSSFVADCHHLEESDYYGIITLDSNNNNSNTGDVLAEEDHSLFIDFNDLSSVCPPDLSDWEQRLLDNYVEIPELVDFLPERTPLCTDNCVDFLEESNSNLRLAAPPPPPPEEPAVSAAPQLGQNAGGERGYLCTFGDCEKIYAKPAHLKAHLRRHLGEKPYACSWPDCTWRFSRSDELARHRRSHSGVKPYKCDYCSKCFARSDHLTKHRKVHERRLLAATRAGRLLSDDLYAVRPGRKRKNQI
ncbi:hypothetical protein KR038_001625 [Drosophila bunnanda]|nr:hypothetical protein KR038_001625 [Drosophila bunnanda]